MNASPPQALPIAGGLASRALTLVYGGVCYLIFLATFLYAIGFVANLAVPKTIDSGVRGTTIEAIAVDLLLLGLFAVQHSVMARPAFKRWWTRLVPQQAERSTYVLLSSLALALLFWQWRAMPEVVWQIEHPAAAAALWAFSALGWLLVLASTCLIDHFDLFGLRQAYLFAVGKPYAPPSFRTPALYRVIRHPIMLGFVIAFWATPLMTWGHLLFALMTTAYIIIGILLEERDLRMAFGSTYDDYRASVGMLIPWFSSQKK